MNNCFQTSKKILELLKIRFTNKYLKEEILSHPHLPSLLTLSDVMEKYNISQVPLKIGKENYPYAYPIYQRYKLPEEYGIEELKEIIT